MCGPSRIRCWVESPASAEPLRGAPLAALYNVRADAHVSRVSLFHARDDPPIFDRLQFL